MARGPKSERRPDDPASAAVTAVRMGEIVETFDQAPITHQSIIKTTFLLYKTAGRAIAVG